MERKKDRKGEEGREEGRKKGKGKKVSKKEHFAYGTFICNCRNYRYILV